MENNKEKALNQFLGAGARGGMPPKDPTGDDPDNNKEVVIKEREGLIERVDKVLITRDGKQLLREQY